MLVAIGIGTDGFREILVIAEGEKEDLEGWRTFLCHLATPLSVQNLQTALHAKAKENSRFRFYSLYDKVHREDVLLHAYRCCRANGGAAGVTGCDSRTSLTTAPLASVHRHPERRGSAGCRHATEPSAPSQSGHEAW